MGIGVLVGWLPLPRSCLQAALNSLAIVSVSRQHRPGPGRRRATNPRTRYRNSISASPFPPTTLHYTPPTQSSLFPTRLHGVINDMVVSDTSSRGNYRIINFCGHMRCSFASIRGGRKEAKMAGCGSRISDLWVTNRVIEVNRTLVDILQCG